MRTHGRASAAAGYEISDHVCWAYTDDEEFTRAAVTFLADGLRANQRLMYVSSRSRDQMLADVARLGAAHSLVADGRLVVRELDEVYEPGRPVALDDQLAQFAAAVGTAVADGYTGLRVVGEVTALVRDPARRAGQLRFEHLAEHYMASGNPLTAMCAYDRRILPAEVVSDLAVVHPLVHEPDELSRVRLFFSGDRLVLTGTLDTFNSAQVRRLLTGSHVREGVLLDVGMLEFIDGRGVAVLGEWGRRLVAAGGTLTIENASPVLRRVWQAVGFDRLEGVEIGGMSA